MTKRELTKWQGRFTATADLLPGVICELDRNLRIIYVNTFGFETFKYSQDEIEGGIYLDALIHPEDLERGKKNLSRVLEGEDIGPQEYRLLHGDGVTVEYEVNSAGIFEDGKLLGLRACAFDISSRVNTRRQLQESESRFRAMFEHSPVGVALFNPDGTILSGNRAFHAMFHNTCREAPPSFSATGDLFAVVQLSDSQQQALRDGESIRFAADLDISSVGMAEQECIRYLEWYITPIEFDWNNSPVWLTQVQDSTERKLAERAVLDKAHEAAKTAQLLVEKLQNQLDSSVHFHNIISKSPLMKKIFDILPMMSETDATLLISGDSGTGKELIAKALHQMGPRKDRPFVAINCGALPDNLLESELFGYKAGAFTDAKKDKPGKFAMAEEGIIFLDEIGDVSPAMQAKLLRVLEEKTYEPLGGTQSITANVRVVAATHRDLSAMVQSGEFRADLFYRLNVLTIKLPPLKERRGDILLLCDHFIRALNKRYNKSIIGIDKEVESKLLAHDFPGNIRELENIFEHAFVFCGDEKIQLHHLPEQLAGSASAIPPRALASFNSLDDLEAEYLRAILCETGGNKIEAAKRLGIHKSTLFRKLNKYGIDGH